MLLDVLVVVVVVVAVAATGGLAGLCERAGNECLDAGVAAALGACIDRDAGLGKRVDGAAADTAADERVNATVGKQTRQCTVTSAAGAHDLLVEDLVVVMGEYAMLPPSMTIARPLTSAFATLRCERLQIAATVARAIPMHWATSS